jgi:hypothetical protein
MVNKPNQEQCNIAVNVVLPVPMAIAPRIVPYWVMNL